MSIENGAGQAKETAGLSRVAAKAGSLASQISAALTLASAAGLVATAVLTLPEHTPRIEGKTAAIVAPAVIPPPALPPAALPPAEARGQPPAGGELIRARAVTVSDVVVKDAAGVLETLAGQSRRTRTVEAETVPSTTWDGSPVINPAPAAPAAKVPAVKADAGPAKPAAGKDQPETGTKSGSASKDSAPKKPDVPAKTAAPEKPAPAAGPAGAAAVPAPPAAEQAPEAWTDAEVAGALRECLVLLGTVAAEIEPAEPTRKGRCGAPAPVKLKSVGHGSNKIEFTPALEVNCKLAVKLAAWSENHLQPAAKDLLGTTVKRITGGGGYSCRNRYGLAVAPLSEHALANAVDLPAFVLSDGRTVKVVSDWGPTDRDIEAARIAAASGSASKPDAKSEPAGEARPDSSAAVRSPGAAKPDDGKKSAPKSSDQRARDKTAGKEAAGPDPAKQAGPDTKIAPATGAADRAQRKIIAVKAEKDDMQKLGAGSPLTGTKGPVSLAARSAPSAKFLRRISAGACATFGTVLGPEANDAHRDHFHFDLKERRKTAYCQ